MLSVKKFTVTAGTTKADPQTETLKLPPGVIRYISVMIPAGHQAEAGLQIYLQEFQIAPFNRGEWIEGEDETIPWEEWLSLVASDRTLKFKGFNDDATNDHTFYIRINVEPPVSVVTPQQILEWLL